MASQEYQIPGIANWAKVFPNNKDLYGGEAKFVIDVEVTDDVATAFKNTGSRTNLKRGENGKYFVRLRRKEINPVAEELGGPPRVTDKDGKDTKDLIGNGSHVLVTFVVYDTKLGKGTRLEAVQVTELVPFEKGAKGNPIVLGTDDPKVPF